MKRLAVVFAVVACAKEPPPSPELLAAREALREREQKLTSFHLEAESTEQEDSARYTFTFAAPNLAAGRVQGARDVELAFDGKQLVRIDHAAKTYDVQPAPELLHAVFAPFAPEGFRSPLLPTKGVTAKKVRHARAQDAVELTTSPGDGITVTWVLRMPAGDFLEKRTVNGAHTGILGVVTEQCDGTLRLCVPTKLTETFDDAVLGKTTLSTVELNPKPPPGVFAPQVPDGYRTASTPASAR